MQKLLLLIAITILCASAGLITRSDPLNADFEPLWYQGERVSADKLHTVHFAIKLNVNAEAACPTLLEQVSDPDSSAYGQYYSLEEVAGLFSNTKAARFVEFWIVKNGMKPRVTLGGEFITVTATIGKLEQVLNAKFYNYHSNIQEKTIIRTESYSLPEEVARHVDFVSHTINYPPIKSRFLSLPEQSGSVTPQTLFSTYNIQNPTVTNMKSNQSLFEALGQDYAPADLTAFQQQYNLPQVNIANVIGPNDPTQCPNNPNACGEANLDVEYIMAVAQNSPTTYWSIDPNSVDPFLDWIIALAGTAYPPLVHSMSYGSIAKEDDSHDVYRFNTEVCKLGLRGVTIMIASGDDGVANFLARNNQSACGFSPSWPATCPYVTAVGATQGPESGQPEIACSSSTGGIVTSGGGFSIYYAQPTYQAAAVKQYFASAPNLPPTSMFNAQGRGYPDVALLGYNYNVVIGGQTYQESGTSASTPVFAGLVTLVNNARLNAGKSPVGFLNPALYKLAVSTPGIFNDITVGENNCCAGQQPSIICCQYGFNATVGWDPLTGLGSVNFANFLAALTAL